VRGPSCQDVRAVILSPSSPVRLRRLVPLVSLVLPLCVVGACAGIKHTVSPPDVLPAPPRETLLTLNSRTLDAPDSLIVHAADTVARVVGTRTPGAASTSDSGAAARPVPPAPTSGKGIRTRRPVHKQAVKRRGATVAVMPPVVVDTIEAADGTSTVVSVVPVTARPTRGSGVMPDVEVLCTVIAPPPSAPVRSAPVGAGTTIETSGVRAPSVTPRDGVLPSWFGLQDPSPASGGVGTPVPVLGHGAFRTACVTMTRAERLHLDSLSQVHRSRLLPSRFERFTDGRGINIDSVNAVERDSIYKRQLQWRPLESFLDSLDYKRAYVSVFPHLRPGSSLAVRSMVWPNDATILTRVAKKITMATDWIPLDRINANELRCATSVKAKGSTDIGSSLRLRAEIVPQFGGDALITVHEEVNRASGCELSLVGRDRLAAFRYDIWAQLTRIATLDPNEIVLP
jgi:hypothetical protein